MTTSQYAYSIHQQRHELLAQLVSRVLQVQPDDDNYELALDFCLQKAYYHTFPDVNPRETEALYAGLVARLEEDSQLTKAAALSALTSKLLALKLPPSPAGMLDLNHNLLQLLASLANQPLSSSLELTPDVLDLLYASSSSSNSIAVPAPTAAAAAQQPAAGASNFQRLLRATAAASESREAAGSSAASSNAEFDPFADGSSLSDWDAEGDDSSTWQQQRHTAWVAEQEASSEADEAPPQCNQQQQVQQPDAADQLAQRFASELAAASKRAAPSLPHGCVVPGPQQPVSKLVAAQRGRAGQQPQAQLLPHQQHQQQQLCLSEWFLTQQVLRVLQGLPAQGFVIKGPTDLSTQQWALPDNGSGSWQARTANWAHSIGRSAGSSTTTTSSSRTSSQQAFAVDPRVCTPHMLPCSLHAMLAEVAAAGTAARQLRLLAQQLAFSSTLGDTNVAVTPCLRALGVALQQQLDTLGMQLAGLQQQARPPAHQQQQQRLEEGGGRGGLVHLIKQQARPVVRRLHLLHTTVCGILRQLSGPPAAVSAGLIDGLAAAVQSAANGSGQQGTADAAALLHLLLSSCVPLSRALAQWLWCAADGLAERESAAAGGWAAGDTPLLLQEQRQRWQAQQGGPSVCSQDFFIVRRAAADVLAVHPTFWHTAYAAAAGRTAGQAPGASGGDCWCPAVLAPFAGKIMRAGKSMRLLDYMEQRELKSSNLCSSSSSSGGGSNTAALLGGAQQPGWGICGPSNQQQQQPAAGAGGSVLLRHPSTPRGRRPSSAGHLAGSTSSTAGAGSLAGRLSRQPSLTSRPYSSSRPASASAAVGKVGSSSSSSSGRKKWDDGAPASAVAAGAAAAAGVPAGLLGTADVSKRVRLQLAAAASVAGRQAHEDLPQQLISTACFVLQQERQLQEQGTQQLQHQQQQLCGSSGEPGAQHTAADVLRQRLEAIAGSLAQPHDLGTGQGLSAACQQQQPSSQQPSLREALAAARRARLAGAAQLDSQGQVQAEIPQQQATAGAGGQPLANKADGGSSSDVQPVSTSSTSSAAPAAAAGAQAEADSEAAAAAAKQDACTAAAASDHAAAVAPTAPTGPTADCAVAPSAASSSSSDGPDVPKLTAWRDQMEVRLTAAGRQLQRMAPWQQTHAAEATEAADGSVAGADTQQLADAGGSRQQHGKGKAGNITSSSGGGGSWLLRAAATQAPGNFTGSLGELWPLKPIVGLGQAMMGQKSSRGAGGSSSSSAAWLQGAAWPESDLSWLLHDPPAHLPSVHQLLSSALVQPVMARVSRVDRQLMSSLMGEWGMLQQLQGLVNVFLIASPSMVAWVDALFSAVQAAQPCAGSSSGGQQGGAQTPPSAKKSAARTAAVGGGAAAGADGCGSPVAAGGSRTGGGGLPVSVEHLEVESLAMLLQECLLCAGPDEVLPEPGVLELTCDTAAIRAIRQHKEGKRQQQQQQQPGGAGVVQEPGGAGSSNTTHNSSSGSSAGAGSSNTPSVRVTGGLMVCSQEWAGLDLQHTGSWQLSLLYTDEQRKTFSKVWRLMLQLRWVRHCVGAAAVAHRSSAAVNNLLARDREEAGSVRAAIRSADSSRVALLGRSSSAGPTAAAAAAAACSGPAVSGSGLSGSRSFGRHAGHHAADEDAAGDDAFRMMSWLPGKEELLLLQEMWHFVGCWQAHVLGGIRVTAWGELEQVLLTAHSLDQVLAATSAFFSRVCALCNAQPCLNRKVAGMHEHMASLMDVALQAAVAAGRVDAARHKLQRPKALSGREADTQAWWLELGAARTALHGAAGRWRSHLGQLLQTWRVFKSFNLPHAFDDLLDTLDMNGVGVASAATIQLPGPSIALLAAWFRCLGCCCCCYYVPPSAAGWWPPGVAATPGQHTHCCVAPCSAPAAAAGDAVAAASCHWHCDDSPGAAAATLGLSVMRGTAGWDCQQNRNLLWWGWMGGLMCWLRWLRHCWM